MEEFNVTAIIYVARWGARVIKITRGCFMSWRAIRPYLQKYSDQMHFNEVYTRGGESAGDRGWKQEPEDSKVHKLFFHLLPLDVMKKRDRFTNSGVHSVFRLLCCSELGNLNKLFSNKKGKKIAQWGSFCEKLYFRRKG